MFETHSVLGRMCTVLAEQTVLSMSRLFNISHCKILYSVLPSFRGLVWSILTLNFFYIFKTVLLGTWELHWKTFCDFMCWSRKTMSGNTILRKLTVQQSVGARTVTQPAFIRVLTLFNIYFTAFLHITLDAKSEHRQCFPSHVSSRARVVPC